jgi:hypothetical protein
MLQNHPIYLLIMLHCSMTDTSNLSIKPFLRRSASWSSGQEFLLLFMRSRVRFPVLPWGFFLDGEDCHGDHGLGRLVELGLRPLLVLHTYILPSTSSGQRNCASWAFQPQTSVTFEPQPGGETTKSTRDMWWYWGKTFLALCDRSILYAYWIFSSVMW